MKQQVTISQIAADLGMSPTTVSRALSGKGRISQKTKTRIADYIQSRQIEPHIRKKQYDGEETRTILVTLPGEGDYVLMPYFMEILSSLHDYFSLLEYQVMIAKITATDISELKRLISQRKVDGVILTRTIEEGIEVAYLQEVGIPFVAVGGYKDPSIYHVDANQIDGCKDLTSVLLHMGIRNIALFCADPTHIVTQERYAGFLKAYEEQHLTFDPKMLFDGTGDYQTAERMIRQVLLKQTDCIICMDDNICINVLNILRKNHIQVPEEIKVASFYNSRLLDGYYPSVSCVSFDTRELGMAAGKMLYALLQKEDPGSQMLSGYTIMLKESTQIP